MKLRTLAAACALAASAALPAQAQDAAKALNLFNSLMRPQQGNNSAPAPAGLPIPGLNNLAPQQGGAQAAAAAAPDLLRLLSQSLEQIDEPKEIEIGRQLSAVLLGSKPLYLDVTMQRYVNQVGRWVTLHSSRPDLPWTFAVLDDPGFNAFAAPGGYVFVTRGLVESVANEGELAGILAHEVIHVTGKHHLKALRKNARAGLLTTLIGSQLKGDAGGALSGQLMTLGRDVYARGLDQDDELDADRSGVALAARAGFDPYGLVSVLQQLGAVAPADPAFALTLSTHPPVATRLDQLEKSMGDRLDPLAGKPIVTVAQRMEVMNRPPASPAATPARAGTPARATGNNSNRRKQ
ncbi:MAG: M48 family metalloprotease [Burkholderiaceae bacterium]